VARHVPPAADGTNSAFASSPAVAQCRLRFEAYRAAEVDAAPEKLEASLRTRLRAFQALGDCLEPLRARPPATAWAANYLEGLAAFEFGTALQALAPEDRTRVGELPDGPARPFRTSYFSGQARDRLDQAKPLAPEAALGFVERYLDEAILLDKRAR
jgi:hypothetical protein